MKSSEIRKSFTNFFESKQHKIVPSAPMVIKGDPTLMFTNAGMNQFKDIFLGLGESSAKRIADSQKCLRVSGKHNDLEEVGHDTYHHTMFEMLGNWSFGDYFKEDAISWAWEYLTEVLKIEKKNLYVTVFGGAKDDNLDSDEEAKNIWKKYIPEDRIIYGSKKDNFWEMGDTGPCGPCSEIHVDLRGETEKTLISGRDLVNHDNPLVIEIWNLVFIQYNRKKGGLLEQLPAKHVDTGMGFERLCMVVQNKKSNYDTDVFQPIIGEIAKISGKKYGFDDKINIAMRVIADHLRTVSFSITDGQLPSNSGAGYVIRRILRRAVRYAYTFLDAKEPFMFKLTDSLIKVMGDAYPELKHQKLTIEKVIREEEFSFLRTLETGIKLLDKIIEKTKANNLTVVNGHDVFVLYDTFGFPTDLTELILRENELSLDKTGYEAAMKEQKERSQDDAASDKDDWTVVSDEDSYLFVGYDFTEINIKISRYRRVVEKGKTFFHLVFNQTPFYAESGGQSGDTGEIENEKEKISILDTLKEHNLSLHLVEKLPNDITAEFKAIVNREKRQLTKCNHSATHLMHLALQKILGNHVEQRGSLVDENRLRFDFSHFQKMSAEEIHSVEHEVNRLIRNAISLAEYREVPIAEAKSMGAKALFGEKYGEKVRIIKFDESIELCGGTHVGNTSEIGMFKIVSESAIAAGIRRIEAITSKEAELFFNRETEILNSLRNLLKNPKNILQSVENLLEENSVLKKEFEKYEKDRIKSLKDTLYSNAKKRNGLNIVIEYIDTQYAGKLKDIAVLMRNEIENLFLVLAAQTAEGKVNLTVAVSDNLVKEKGFDAGKIIREIAKEIDGSGGGQPTIATAGGKKPQGIDAALKKAESFV